MTKATTAPSADPRLRYRPLSDGEKVTKTYRYRNHTLGNDNPGQAYCGVPGIFVTFWPPHGGERVVCEYLWLDYLSVFVVLLSCCLVVLLFVVFACGLTINQTTRQPNNQTTKQLYH